MSSFCRYVTARLHISDVLSWLMSRNPVLIGREGEIERWTLPGNSCSYPLGANGFVFRRADLESVKREDHFQDTHIPLALMQRGQREWLRVRGRGVHHYYVQTLGGYVRKRRRAIAHYFRVRDQSPVNWMNEKPPVPIWLAGLYCVALVGPFWHALRGWVRDRDAAWLWHIFASPGSFLGTAWGWWTYKTRRGESKLVANLQVEQTLKPTAVERYTQNIVPGGRPKLHLITNGVFTTSIAGGDIHFLKLAEGAARAGYELNFFGGHALKEVIEKHKLPGTVTLTDDAKMPKVNQSALGGQWAMFRDMYGRYRRTLALRGQIKPEDYVYAVSDYWFDVVPAVRCPALRKLMVLHMEAPTLGQIISRGRPDVDPKRLASFHYWASQEWSLRRFAACARARSAELSPSPPSKGGEGRGEEGTGKREGKMPTAPRIHLLYLHPLMEPRLNALGVGPDRRTLLSYGLDLGPTDAVPEQPRVYDAVWIGRVHRQKGIDDLLTTLQHLANRLPDFKCIVIGNVRDALAPEIAARGLEKHVEFSGFVTEEEKIRLFKASRVFLMPSKHEGSPRVIGESLICKTPVVAYEIPNYRPLFGDFVRYAPPFDLEAFKAAAEREILAMRSGKNYLDGLDLSRFRNENSWETTQAKFLATLERLAQ